MKKQIIIERCYDGMIAVHTNFDCEISFLDSQADEYNADTDVLEEYEKIEQLKNTDEFEQRSDFYW